MTKWGVIAASLVVACSAWGQVAAPLLGYLADGNKVQPVYGIPAAATVAAPIRTGEDVGRAIAVRDTVLILEADEGEVSMFIGGALKYVAGTVKAPEKIGLSATGQAAVLWSGSHLQILSELAGTPVLRSMDVSFRGGSPASFAVSDDGRWVAGSWADGCYALGPNGEVVQVPGLDGAVTALEFFPGSHDLGLATERALWMVADVGGRNGSRAVWRMNSEDEGTLQAVAVAGGRGKLHAATATGAVLTVPVNERETSGAVRVACECAPTGLARMAGNAFRLTGPVEGAIKLFDGDSGAVLFAPLRPVDTSNRLGGRSR